MVVLCIYTVHANSGGGADIDNLLSQCLESKKSDNKYQHIIFAGDFNLDLKNPKGGNETKRLKNLKDNLDLNVFPPFFPTRKSRYLDGIVSYNAPQIKCYAVGNTTAEESDHLPAFFKAGIQVFNV